MSRIGKLPKPKSKNIKHFSVPFECTVFGTWNIGEIVLNTDGVAIEVNYSTGRHEDNNYQIHRIGLDR